MTSETYEDSWDLARSRNRAALVSVLLGLVVVIQGGLLIAKDHQLDRSYQKEAEYRRQISTLIAENRRLREHCQAKEPLP